MGADKAHQQFIDQQINLTQVTGIADAALAIVPDRLRNEAAVGGQWDLAPRLQGDGIGVVTVAALDDYDLDAEVLS